MADAIPKLDLLILDQLLDPTDGALEVLSDIGTDVNANGGSGVALTAMLALAVGQIEIALSETMKYILKRNPWKMEFTELHLKRPELLSSELVRELLESHAERIVRGWAYGPGDQLLQRFNCVVGFPKDNQLNWSDRLDKLRQRRNEILHQGRRDLVWPGSTPWANIEELKSAIADITLFLTAVRDSLQIHYGGYTRIAALRRLWTHLFQSPIMIFDHFWILNEKEDKIVGINMHAPFNSLATSERMILGLWHAEFSGDATLLKDFNMKHLDSVRRRDLVTLIAALREIWVY